MIGLSGPTLNTDERGWLRRHPPQGVILFARNIESPSQVAVLLDDVRQCAGSHVWAAIDEEGGRVTRLPWPPFSSRRPAREYGAMFADAPGAALRAVHDDACTAGAALRELGFTHNCAPVLDVFHASADAVIGSRAYSPDVHVVAELGAACMRGLREAGVEAVGKHFPGHGRADADSHLAVPRVDTDVSTLLNEALPFRVCVQQGMKHVMTAHVVYTQADTHVATLSEFWLRDVLRERFSFSGSIWSDDLCMNGVGHDVYNAAIQAVRAGCDVLLVCEPDGVRRIYETLP